MINIPDQIAIGKPSNVSSRESWLALSAEKGGTEAKAELKTSSDMNKRQHQQQHSEAQQQFLHPRNEELTCWLYKRVCYKQYPGCRRARGLRTSSTSSSQKHSSLTFQPEEGQKRAKGNNTAADTWYSAASGMHTFQLNKTLKARARL